MALGLQSPWQISGIDFGEEDESGRGRLEIRIDFERGGRFPCPECSAPCPAHDTHEQRWRHLDFFQHTSYLIARTPRVKCDKHGVLKVVVPWARPNSGFTMLFEALVLAMATQMPVAAVARLVRETDTRLWRIVRFHVEEAREQVDMSDVEMIVVDETSQAKRKRFVSIFLEPKHVDEHGRVTQPARVLFVAESKAKTVFHAFVRDLEAHGGEAESIREVCMDMCTPYLQGVSETMPWAHVTFDRFHVMKMLNSAVDDARRREAKSRPELKRSRFHLLMGPERLSAKGRAKIEELRALNLQTAKAYQMRLNITGLWKASSLKTARRLLRAWCKWVESETKPPESPLEPWVLQKMRQAARTLRKNERGVLRYVVSRLTSGVIEGVNSLAQAARARARGYTNPETFKTIIYLIAGQLRFDLPLATHSR